jgi:class 3 adenylate cyclase/tetratricopeptide (TPR) repeat protein
MDSLRARLEQLGLGKYTELFAAHRIDLDVLADLTEADFEKLGIALGDRRRLLKAVSRLATTDIRQVQAAASGREAERRQLTVLFADLVDSTKLAARLDPEDMREVISGYQKAVSDEVARCGGYVAKPLGDGLLIYFGWPQAHEDDAERAVRSALAAVGAVARLTTADGQALATRIGIATGQVVVGDFLGGGVDEGGAVVGETPNLAARLQAAAGPNDIVVAEETRRLIGQLFALTDLGEQRLKGFDRPIRAWRIEGERASDSRFDAMHGARLGPFVGREHEIGLLMQRQQEAEDGECQLVLLSGEAGIGKSRLVAEFLRRLDGKARRIVYQGSPLHTNTALYPVIRSLQSRAGIAPDDAASDKWRKLAAAIPMRSPRARLALRFLADLMSLGDPDQNATEAKPSVEEQREALFEVLGEVAQHETEAAPLVIVVEDAHWLDATTQQLVERMLERLQHRPAMVLVTYRPEFVSPWAQHANVGLLSLGRLGRRDSRAIVATLSGGQSLPQQLADDIVAKSDGVPLFVEELTGSALEAFRGRDEREIQIPATLRDSLSERLDRLGSAKEVAQIAAAFGREFSVDLLAATLDRPEDELQADLDRLVLVDIVFRSSRSARRYTFHHALLQEAAYESMLKSKRREVHARISRVLGQRRPEMAETEPEVLATHLARAGDTLRAAECWRKAGHLALRNSAYREAIGAFRSALPLLPGGEAKARADIDRAIASAFFAIGDYRSMRQHLEHAATEAEAAGDQVMVAEIAMQQGHVLNMYGGDLADAVRFGQRALEIATRLDDDALGYGARFTLGQSAWVAGDFAGAIRFFTANLPENLRASERVRDFGTAGSLVLDSMAILGSTLSHCGEFERAFAILDRAIRLATDSAWDISVAHYHLNRAHLQRGDAAAALPLLVESVRHATESGLKFNLVWHQALLGYARALVGEADQAASLLQQAFEDADPLHLPYVKALTSVFLAETLADSRPERALEVAESGLKVARARGYRAQEAELLRAAAAALARTDPAGAEARLNEALALARRLGMRPEEGHALRVLGAVKLAQGERTAAASCRRGARGIYADLGMRVWLERVSPDE